MTEESGEIMLGRMTSGDVEDAMAVRTVTCVAHCVSVLFTVHCSHTLLLKLFLLLFHALLYTGPMLKKKSIRLILMQHIVLQEGRDKRTLFNTFFAS